MKKIFLFLVAFMLVSLASDVRSNSTSIQNVSSVSKGVPEDVVTTFNGILGNIMEVNFPANPNYDASEVVWDKVKSEWQCSGFVKQIGGNGAGVEIIFANFQISGEFIEFFYLVTP